LSESIQNASEKNIESFNLSFENTNPGRKENPYENEKLKYLSNFHYIII